MNTNPEIVTKVLLNRDECSCILVGLCEFAAVISEEKFAFGAYDKINQDLINKFRSICWNHHRYKKE